MPKKRSKRVVKVSAAKGVLTLEQLKQWIEDIFIHKPL
jgi:hypothetical protein